MLFAVAYVAEYVIVYFVGFFAWYLATCWSLCAGCFLVAVSFLSCCFLLAVLFAVALLLLRMLFAVAYIVEYVVEYVEEYVARYLASCWLLSGSALVGFRSLSGCLLFAVAVVVLRMLFAVAYMVEYVVESGAEYVLRYVASCWLLSGCCMVALCLIAVCRPSIGRTRSAQRWMLLESSLASAPRRKYQLKHAG
jgi:hypothetical protein